MSKLIVLKFGSSVLRTPQDLPVAVHEIYSELREHHQVIAAVSAFEGVTDRLFAEGRRQGLDRDPHALAEFVAKGEQETAAQLGAALDAAGVPARVLEPAEIGLHAAGEPLDATPYELNAAAVREHLHAVSVLVVPGFYACDAHGKPVLLGRGGTDFTALYLAQQLGADCRLVKDVDGIYTADPAKAKQLPPRFARISWEHALEVGGHLVQPRAIQFAREYSQTFGVGSAGNVQTTRVGPGPDTFKTLPHDVPPLRVVLLGLGTVGLGVYRYLKLRPDLFDVRRIVVRDLNKTRDADVPRALLSNDLWDAAKEPADLVIEAIGGVDTVADAIQAALQNGRAVVTANKALIAARWPQLARYAVPGVERRLRFSAAVGGAVPVLETLEALVRRGRIERVRGVVNGTCNFILDAMTSGGTLAAAVKAAQEKGFAEADPRSDLSGQDAAFKLGIIARTAFGIEVSAENIACSGIENLTPTQVAAAKVANKRLRLVASCEQRKTGGKEGVTAAEDLYLEVKLCEVDADDYLAGAHNEENRIEIHTPSGCVRLEGKGAGRWPTAVAVLGDVFAQLRESRSALTPDAY